MSRSPVAMAGPTERLGHGGLRRDGTGGSTEGDGSKTDGDGRRWSGWEAE